MASKAIQNKFLKIYAECDNDFSDSQKLSYACARSGLDEDDAIELLAGLHKADMQSKNIKPTDMVKGSKEWLMNDYIDIIADKQIPVDIRIRAKKEYADLMGFYNYSEDSEMVKAHFYLAEIMEKKFNDKELEYFAYGMEDLDLGNNKLINDDEDDIEITGKVKVE